MHVLCDKTKTKIKTCKNNKKLKNKKKKTEKDLNEKFSLHACCFEVEDLHSTFGFVNLFDITNFSVLGIGVWNSHLLCPQTFGKVQLPHKLLKFF